MSLASARLLIRAATVTRVCAAGRLGLAVTFARCAPLAGSLIHARRGFANAAAASFDLAASAAPSPVSVDVALTSVAAGSGSSRAPANVSAVKSQLRTALMTHDASAAAQRAIDEFEQRGGKCDIAIINQWIKCNAKAGDWEAAERAWTRVGELSLQPNNLSYRVLMQVYTQAGGEQLAKIDPLLSELQAAGLALNARDYQQLIESAHHAGQSAELRRWADRARAAGVWPQLDEAARKIVALYALRGDPSDGKRLLQRWTAMSDQQKRDNSLALPKLLSELKWQPTQAEGIIAECDQIGVALNAEALSAGINCYRKVKDWAGAERLWKRFGELQLRPDTHSYFALLQIYTHVGGEQLAKIDPLLSEMPQHGVQLSAGHYERLIKTADRCKLSAEVRRWIGMARAAGLFEQLDDASHKIVRRWSNRVAASAPAATDAASSLAASVSAALPPTAADYTAIISQLNRAIKAGDATAATRIISAFEERSCTVAMLNLWIRCHEKAGDWQAAEGVWTRFGELGLKPNNVSYRSLMQVYTSAGGDQLAKIYSLLAEMRIAGLVFNSADYERLITTAHRVGRAADIQKWADRARAASVWQSSLQRWSAMCDQQNRDSSFALPKLLAELAADGQSALAERVIADCDRVGVALSAETLNAWISCYCSSKRWEAAERVWKRFGELGLKPDSNSYRALIEVYTRAGGAHLDKIGPLLSEMRRAGLCFSAADYEKLIMSAARNHRAFELSRWIAGARAAGVFDQLSLPRRISRVATRQLDAEAAAQRWLELSDEQKRDASFSLSNVLAFPTPSALAEAIVADCDRLGIALDASALTSWIGCYRPNGNWQAAERVWARFGELGLTPDSTSYRALLHVYTSAGGAQVAKIDPLLSLMQQHGVQLSAKDYEHLIKLAQLPAEVRRWSALARAAGVFDSLDDASRGIVARFVNAPASAQMDGISHSSTAADPSAAARPTATNLRAAKSAMTAVKLQLTLALSKGDLAAVEQAISRFEQSGERRTVGMFARWIECHEKSGDWEAAERVWARIGELGLKPNNHSYRVLMQVYTQAGGEQLAKIDPLLSEMQQSKVRLSPDDYSSLIQCAHQCALATEVCRWLDDAMAADAFRLLPLRVRGIAADCAVQLGRPLPPEPEAATKAESSPSTATAAAIEPDDELRTALGNHSDATLVWRLLSNFELSGGCITTRMYAGWLKCFVSSADWQGAERAWAMLRHRSIELDRRCYAALLQVYTRAGGDQLAKIDPLLSEMRRLSIALEWRDYDNLIGLAATAKLAPREMTRWAELANAAGLMRKLSELAQQRIGRAQQDNELKQRAFTTTADSPRSCAAR